MSAGAEVGKRSVVLVCVALALAVLGTYAEVGSFGFVRYDDREYVLNNAVVRDGLSWDGARWAFTAAHACNWHPLTWLSHMLDVQCFGLAPAGHHWTSVGLHALGSVLCYFALRALTQRHWSSACVAFLFALHPLRVESVAWVSERKDVLSGCAFFGLLWTYARYARAPSAARYAAVLACFALGLLSKPMLVTAPFVLLLLDVWPLQRWSSRERQASASPASPARLLLEKAPLLVLAALSSAMTIWSQRIGGALSTFDVLPLSARLANAPLAVLSYVGHFLWPRGLSYFYPHPFMSHEHISPWSGAVLLALATVLGLSLAACACRRLPVLFVGWFWFLGMLVPVIGIVQVGGQALADRYGYLPLIGLQLALVVPLAELAQRRRRLRAPLATLAALALLACGLASARQARVWKDSEALFRHALAVDDQNYQAWVSLANELADQGDLEQARRHYEQALAVHPSYAPALYGLGLFEQEHGDPAKALELYRRAAQIFPGLAAAHLNLGSLLAQDGQVVEAAQAFERVLELEPEHPDAHYNLALLLLLHGQTAEAVPHLEATVRVQPDHAAAWGKLGETHEAAGEHAAAIDALERALGELALDPRNAPRARHGAFTMAWNRSPSGRNEAIRLLAWILATASESELRDAPRALELARRAVQATERRDPRALEALAAAQAATGEFARAAEIQDEAVNLLRPGQQADARARLERYRSGQAFLHVH